MVNKVHEIMETLVGNSIDLAGICETWLKETNCPTTAAIKSFGYSILHLTIGMRRKGVALLLFINLVTG